MKISNEACDILAMCRFEAGKVLLPATTLDRKLYVEVNKVLEALGLKWDKKSKSHVAAQTSEDLEDLLTQAYTLGEVTTEKDKGLDFFATPDPVASRMLTHEAFYSRFPFPSQGRVLEPSAGDGALARAIKTHYPQITLDMVELDPVRAAMLRALNLGTVYEQDFLQYAPAEQYDAVVMNPPFSKKREVTHVNHALNLLKQGGILAAITSSGVDHREDTLTKDLRHRLLDPLHGVSYSNEDKAFRSSGTNVNTLTFLYRKP